MHTKAYYLELRNEYLPANLELVFIAESPPASGEYFYDSSGEVTEQLFRAMTHDVLGMAPATKREGLRQFAESGFLLVDATYHPVNKGLSGKKRDQRILDDFESLVADLNELLPSRDTGIILIKANVCRLLETRLRSSGFNTLNNGMIIPFPGSGQQTNFRKSIEKLL